MNRIFLKLDGIPGESCVSGHEDCIEILELEWAASQESLSGDGLVCGRVRFDSVTLLKLVDKSSPLLAASCAEGRFLRDAVVECVRPVRDQVLPFYRIRLGDVMISRIQSRTVAGDGNDRFSAIPRERVSLAFAEIKWEYVEFKPDGTKHGAISAGFSLKKMHPL